MSEQQKRPKVGDVVWCRGVVADLFYDDDASRIVKINWNGDSCIIYPAAITHIGDHPPAQERKPWDVLREAAAVLQNHRPGYYLTIDMIRGLAAELEREAAPPDPIALLREYVDGPVVGHDWQERVRAAIAAQDAKKDAS